MDDDAFKVIVTERAFTELRLLAKRGEVVRIGASRSAKWAIPPEFTDAIEYLHAVL